MSGTGSAILRDEVSIGGFQDLNATCQRPLLQNNWIVQSFQNYYTISNDSENSWAILWPTSLAAVWPDIDTTNYLPCLDMFGVSLQAESWVHLATYCYPPTGRHPNSPICNAEISWNFNMLANACNKNVLGCWTPAWQANIALIEFQWIVQLQTLQEFGPSLDRNALAISSRHW